MLEHRTFTRSQTTVESPGEEDDLDLVSMTLTPRPRFLNKERRASRGFLSRVASAVDPEIGHHLGGHNRTASASPTAHASGSPPSNQAHFRLVVLGAARVGKSALIRRFLYGQFTIGYSATIEEMHKADFNLGGASFALDILDTSGSYQFPVMRRLAVERGDAFLLVFSIEDSESFEEVRRLRDLLLEIRPDGAPTVVVANKCDLDDTSEDDKDDPEQTKRCVNREIAEALVCMDWEQSYAECSALTGHGVIEAFRSLLRQAQKMGKLPAVPPPIVKVSPDDEKGKQTIHPLPQGSPTTDMPAGSRSRMRRRSLPVNPGLLRPPSTGGLTRKRNSCAVS